ncbi:hypothetical protein [Undibacterium rugosum]|uniref:hypothetical protein n=1 Tax=Undibacterium rugosum TaxID=2762291 RepID=UPI001B81413D|nr:hypothetical protein [Undibacterium rugosum]MBR7778988.1 hypothetical protein [Undibacterium rugosum]
MKSAIEKQLWFSMLITLIALLCTNLLFSRAHLSFYDAELFSATQIIYLLCWFGFERIFKFSFSLLFMLSRSAQTPQATGAPGNTQLQDIPPSVQATDIRN